MTAAALAFPTGPLPAGWARLLALRQPQATGMGYFRIHHLEALVQIAHSRPLGALPRVLLAALDLERLDSPASSAAGLARTLGLDRSFVCRLLSRMRSDGLVAAARENEPDGGWSVTVLGRDALQRGVHETKSCERRAFSFVDSLHGQGSPRFVPISSAGTGTPLDSVDAPGQQPPRLVTSLMQCLNEAVAWKERHGFPLDLVRIADSGVVAGAEQLRPESWQQVVLDRQELGCALLLRAGEELAAFALRPQGWTLLSETEWFTLHEGEWHDCFAELASEPSSEAWRAGWLSWGQARHLPLAELEACSLESLGTRLRVHAPKPLFHQLHSPRGEIGRGDAWLFAGTGTVRPFARLEMVEKLV